MRGLARLSAWSAPGISEVVCGCGKRQRIFGRRAPETSNRTGLLSRRHGNGVDTAKERNRIYPAIHRDMRQTGGRCPSAASHKQRNCAAPARETSDARHLDGVGHAISALDHSIDQTIGPMPI